MDTTRVMPEQFKGIVLFTPAGDLIYTIDETKQRRWHSHLCAALQELLGLTAPPHFLVPFYTATVDRWWDTQLQCLRTVAEVYPFVERYQALLNTIFQTPDLRWDVMPVQQEGANPQIIASYRDHFSPLWEEHNLIVSYDQWQDHDYHDDVVAMPPKPDSPTSPLIQNYVLRLFVSGDNTLTERTLHQLHELLEENLSAPYTLKVIDIFKHPDLAEMDHISATPTLIRVWPLPVRRIVGEFTDPQRLLQVLTATPRKG
ncbi:circadian clock KaiB family protein [Spirulina major CS-329]|uniref:circadian clock KaiB family protein n=1 Tax=Spirulina TaxID=1154 RepID=UPI00232D4B4D|nr:MULTISPECIES: circadian clock KaiB family protein [Spirulina]MDB9496323.1 circadian clock KaiB family protein [Spirulina subsalsa CS-330]MDB9502012.1 circadian clock KaiB family protein [Spirulina major CS-329]